MSRKEILERWTVNDSADLYSLNNWSSGYFRISERGDLVITPFENSQVSVNVIDIIKGVEKRGMDMPVLLRIENLLDAQLYNLHRSFNEAIKSCGYRGVYRGVYPIKVNQQQQVIEEICKFGARFHHGLEAGSKPELLIALAMIKDHDSYIICNGYKDEEFINLGLQACKIGIKCFFVIEMAGELQLLLKISEELKIKPLIGIRMKPSIKAGGHWSESGGDRSIFGLNTAQIIEMVDILREKNLLDCLKLLHFHIGSQVPDIRHIRSAVVEAARVYVELVEEGATMGVMDFGGGLAVDYDGSKSNSHHSMNYSLKEYCEDLLEVVMSVLDDREIGHPVIVTESGRATVAYYSILVFNVLDACEFEVDSLPDKLPEDVSELVESIYGVARNITLKNLQECLNDALIYRDEIYELFKHGGISLRERSISEKIFWYIINTIAREKEKLRRVPPALEGIDAMIADFYYGNFSVFQSVPDSWAIDQIFPIMPIHRLHEEPERNAVIADITCDCDGKIDRFIGVNGYNRSLPLHALREGEDYYLGIFLVGAYQETLGDLHNLMGDTNIVSVRINENGEFDILRELAGDSIADVLSYVEYDPRTLLETFREKVEQAVRDKKITVEERRTIVKDFQDSLNGYTYYEK